MNTLELLAWASEMLPKGHSIELCARRARGGLPHWTVGVYRSDEPNHLEQVCGVVPDAPISDFIATLVNKARKHAGMNEVEPPTGSET